VVSERNDPTAAGRAVLRKINKIIYPKADVIICQGEKGAEFYRAVSNKCIILPNPLNSSALGTFVSEKNNRIVTVGRMVPEKNQKMLIDAFAMIHSQHRGVILDIIGEGPLQEELEKQIKSLDLNGIVKTHKPMKNDDKS
jgi:glycosyltransferase involved in cell wall biosynthesis